MSQVIAIDGPAASGKGTLARRLAAEFALPYLDTGLLYRAVGRRVVDAGLDPADAAAALRAARGLAEADLRRDDLRGEAAAAAASAVAAMPAVRAALVDWQRDFAAQGGAVLDGRDIGTVIFPEARVKLFVTASLAVRARRRFLELAAAAPGLSEEAVREELAARDARDMARAPAPLLPAPDAVIIDTSDMDAGEAFERALAVARARLG